MNNRALYVQDLFRKISNTIHITIDYIEGL